ncbi:zinc-binding dehydrogenase [bacterium]|nr:zinc-binding dehydrogenase [bacterium]
MKAVLLTKHGGVDSLEFVDDYPTPSPSGDEVLVRVMATGLNQVDQLILRGYPGIAIPLPHIQGGDIAGVVAGVGPDVQGWKEGDRVLVFPIRTEPGDELAAKGLDNLSHPWQFYGMQIKGGHCEYVAVPQRNLVRLPDSVDFGDAVQLGVAGLTAMHGLSEKVGDLQPGQQFFIWGGAGGLGTIAIQLAKLKGATVHAVASSPEKLEAMKELGADFVYNRSEMDYEAIGNAVRGNAPAGIDLILDYVGPGAFQTNWGLLAKGGTMAFCGILTGVETTIHLQFSYLRQLRFKGYYLGNRPDLEQLVALVADGKIKAVKAAEFSLADAGKAHQFMDSNTGIGKVVIRVD